jgi:hypothetical protein
MNNCPVSRGLVQPIAAPDANRHILWAISVVSWYFGLNFFKVLLTVRTGEHSVGRLKQNI